MNKNSILLAASLLVCLFFSCQTTFAQYVKEVKDSQSVGEKRSNGLQMLDDIKTVVKRFYYDPQYRGINIDERFKKAKETVKTQDTNGQIFRTIAQVLLDFNDSHTKFYPPNRSTVVEYGFTMQAMGNNCFVTNVKKGSDAESKGLRAGDQLLDFDGIVPDRSNLWILEYVMYSLDPRDTFTVKVRDGGGKEKTLEIKAALKTLEDRQKELKARKEKRDENLYKCAVLNADLVTCKLKSFVIENKDLDAMMETVGQRKQLILDLRGNGGGYLKALAHLTGYFFDQEIKIGDEKLRDKTIELKSKTHKDKVFRGDLIVLVDSDSGSAAEMFSGVVRMEKRGKIVGDVTAGAVMASYSIPMNSFRGSSVHGKYSFYGISVTIADFILRDGTRLEGVGVVPDVLVGPASYALLNKYDPVLSYAARMFGAEISQEKAGELYFMMEKPEDNAEEKDIKKEEGN